MSTAQAKEISARIEAADLTGAVAEALTWVKQEPTNTEARRVLIDTLILAEDFERADNQANILAKTAPEFALGMGLLRGRLRAANARRAWFTEGAVPAFPNGPTDRDKLAMKLSLATHGGDGAAAETALSALTDLSSTSGMRVNGAAAGDFRDADDRVPHALEVLCTDGSYMWVDHALVESCIFEPLRAMRDLAWRPAKLTLKSVSESDVVICATYFAEDSSDSQKLARETDWAPIAGGAMHGKGQKVYLVGDDAVGALDITEMAEG
jgi:type VI secretion system protein ImpE